MEKKAKVKICYRCGYGIPVWSEICLRCEKSDLSSIKTNATINSTLKSTEQEKSEAMDMKVSSKQQSLSRTRKKSVNDSKRTSRKIKSK